MRPCGCSKCVVVPKDRSHVRIDPEPLTDEFHRHDILCGVIVLQPLRQRDLVSFDRLDARDFVAFHIVGADKKQCSDMILLGILHRNDSGAFLDGRRQHCVHRDRKPFGIFLLQHRERTNRLLIGESGDHTVRCLVVELQEVPMRIDLRGLEVRVIVVIPFTGQRPIHAIVDIAAHDQRILQVVVGANGCFFLVQHINQPVGINHRRLFPLRLRDLDRHLDEMHIVALPPGIDRTKAPISLFSGLRLIETFFSVVVTPDHLQPGRPDMVRREHDTFPEMWSEMRPGHLPG